MEKFCIKLVGLEERVLDLGCWTQEKNAHLRPRAEEANINTIFTLMLQDRAPRVSSGWSDFPVWLGLRGVRFSLEGSINLDSEGEGIAPRHRSTTASMVRRTLVTC